MKDLSHITAAKPQSDFSIAANDLFKLRFLACISGIIHFEDVIR